MLKLQPSLGALEIGFLASGFLFGVLTAQALIYHRKFIQDSWALKLLVGVIWFLEFAQFICVSHAMYTITITHSGDPRFILKPPLTVGIAFLSGSSVGPLVEAFYISRLLKFSGKLYPALFCWALAFLRFGGWVLLSVNAIKMQSLIEFKTEFGWLFGMLLGASAGIDLIVAAWIGYFLGKQRDEANPTATKLLDKIILWTLQTGVITSMAFLVTLFCFLVWGQNLIWLALSASLTKVVSNCWLASVNSRSPHRHRLPARAESRNTESRNTDRTSRFQNEFSTVGNIVELYDNPNYSNTSFTRTTSNIDSQDDTPTSTVTEFWAI